MTRLLSTRDRNTYKNCDDLDETKRLANLVKHGVDFRDLEGLDWERSLIFEDRSRYYGEMRLIAMTPLGRRLHVIVFVERSAVRRIISARGLTIVRLLVS